MLASINVIDLGARSFHTMAATGRYFVRALLVGISMGIRENAGNFDARKGDVMFVDSRYPNLALQETRERHLLGRYPKNSFRKHAKRPPTRRSEPCSDATRVNVVVSFHPYSKRTGCECDCCASRKLLRPTPTSR